MIPGSNPRKPTFLSVSLISLFLLLIRCNEKQYELAPELEELTEQDYINRREYFVSSIGCHNCHSPKKMEERGLK